MQRPIALGMQSFSKLRETRSLYIDKTHFIKEWWEQGDDVTLLTRPRRFGKTLLLDMVRTFFSVDNAHRPELFECLSIWNEEKYRKLYGTIPVIYMSFSNVNARNFSEAKYKICSIITKIYFDYAFLLTSGILQENEILQFKSISADMSLVSAVESINYLSQYIALYYGKKPIVIIDDYDYPMQEAFMNGYLNDLNYLFHSFLNYTLKTNQWMERGLLSGITYISNESLFSDLNNWQVITATTPMYTDYLGFTEEETFALMNEYSLQEKENIKKWYGGFIFGRNKNIYNPWSILKYIRYRELNIYSLDISFHHFLSKFIKQSNSQFKMHIEALLQGKTIIEKIDERISWNHISKIRNSMLTILIALGYIKVISCDKSVKQYAITITNQEMKMVLYSLISEWFNTASLCSILHEFINALCEGNILQINDLMNKIVLETFNCFSPSEMEPERFYHGFVLGLIVDLKERYCIESNRESGFGRYDVLMFPLSKKDPGIVIEFKSIDSDAGEKALSETVVAARKQIADKHYAAELAARGIPDNRIFTYGFAFRGKDVLIGGGPL